MILTNDFVNLCVILNRNLNLNYKPTSVSLQFNLHLRIFFASPDSICLCIE